MGSHDRRMARVLVAFAGLALSDSISAVTVTLFAFAQGGATSAGVALGLTYLPAVVAAPLVSDMGATMSRGTRLVVGYGASAAVLALLALLVAVDAPLLLVVAVGALANVAISVARPTHYAVLPQVASSPGALVRGNSTTSFGVGVGNFVGPAVTGVVAALGLLWLAPALGALLLAAAAVLCAGLGLPASEPMDDHSDGLVARLRSVSHDGPVMLLLLLSSLMYLVLSALTVLGVSFAANVLGEGEAAQGLLVAAPAIGAILGSIAGAGLAYRRRLAPVFVLGVMASGLLIAAVSLASRLGPAAGLLVVVGLTGTVGGLASETLVQRAVTDAALLRVMAMWESLSVLGYTLGAFAAPVLVAVMGPRGAYLPLGLGMAVSAVVVVRRLRPLDDRAEFRTDVMARLRGVGFLSGLPPAGLDRIARSAAWVEVSDGQDVVVQGDVGDAYFVLDTGACDVVVDGAFSRTLGSGDGFGEIALLFDVPRTATVTAREPGRLLRVDRDDFLAALSRNPDGRRSAVAIAAQLVDDTVDLSIRPTDAVSAVSDEQPDDIVDGDPV